MKGSTELLLNHEKLFTETDLYNWLSFCLFFSFLFYSVLFYWLKKKNKAISIFLLADLTLCLLLFFTDLGWIQEISIKVFFLTFFIASQSDFDVKNKTLRVLSYLFFGLVLLESFEYFIWPERNSKCFSYISITQFELLVRWISLETQHLLRRKSVAVALIIWLLKYQF